MEASGRSTVGNNVCVVGAGMVGLVAIKNLKEQGLNPTAFTKDDYVGGMWHFTDDPEKTSALEQTTTNTSTQCNIYTDFPMPYGSSTFATARELAKHFESYAENFDLYPHIRFSEAVISVDRDDKDEKWVVVTKNTTTGKEVSWVFDRVVLATGILNKPKIVNFKGVEKFEGDYVYSRAFKDPHKYKGKNVLVVGIGASGSDTLVFLKQAGASKVYASHRGQYLMLPKDVEGKAFDHGMSRRAGTIIRWIASVSTDLCGWIMLKALAAARDKAFPFMKNHPSNSPPREPPTVTSRLPFFSNYLAGYFRDGDVQDVQGLKEITGPRSVRLADGMEIDDLDAIILCTGYDYDMSFIKGKGNPTDPKFAPDGYSKLRSAPFTTSQDFPRLYRGFISEQYPESLAILGHFVIPRGPFVVYDLATMALASLWSGDYPLPTKEEMSKDIEVHYNFILKCLRKGPMPYWGFRLNSRDTYMWINRVAGTGVVERLGSWGLEAWKLWFSEPKFYKLLMDGIDVPAVYRLFDTGRGRKPWPGARSHIIKMNEEVAELGVKWQREHKAKTK